MTKDFADFAREVFASLGWLERSGSVLFTSPDSIRPARTLIMGTNPGGSVETHTAATRSTLNDSLNDFATRPAGWSAWFKEGDWGSNRTYSEPGSAPLQKAVARVLEVLGYPAGEAGNVCSTQLIFLRSRDTGKLEGNFYDLAEACWPINERILREVRPAQIMLIGNGESRSPWSFLRKKFLTSWNPRQPVPYGRATARLKAADFLIDDRPVTAIGFPHFSRFGVPPDLDRKLEQLSIPTYGRMRNSA